ncbi:LssY C-terminal domain-containing protein [Photobacterium damselae subsp. damselae]
MFDWWGLFIGALCDALIGPNIIFVGEPFLLAAGYQLYSGAYIGVIAVFLGGWLGDQLSYLIGRKGGSKLQKKLIQRFPKIRRPVAKCRLLLQKRGGVIIAVARLLGPVAWVMPFIAGMQKVSWQRFSLYSVIGLLLGIGQFVFLGYILAAGASQYPDLLMIKAFLFEHYEVIALLLLVILLFIVDYKYQFKRLWLKAVLVILCSLGYINFSHFFWNSDDFNENTVYTTQRVDLNSLEFKAYPGKPIFTDAQAINLIFIGNNPHDLMDELGWIQNETFSRNEIELFDYINLLRQKTPPISDLFWQGIPQHLAYQKAGSLLKRSHVRWWKVGFDSVSQKPIWGGAISYDDGIKLTWHSGILTVLHSISAFVDEERDLFKNSINNLSSTWYGSVKMLAKPIYSMVKHDYITDGGVLVIESFAHLPSLKRDNVL